MGYRVAVVGATGNVGREMLNILEELNFPVDEMHAIASRKSIGVEVAFGDKTIKCEDIEQFDFSTVDIVLMSAGGAVSKEWSREDRRGRPDRHRQLLGLAHGPGRAADRAGGEPGRRRGCAQEEHHRQPQLLDRPAGRGAEAAARRGARSSGWWSRPTSRSPAPARKAWTSCGTRPRPSSCLGAAAPKKFPKQIAFNVIPFIGAFNDDGYTDEEPRCGTRPTRCSIPTSS